MKLFHHHDLEIVSYEKATACEKAIYYSCKSHNCSHKAHISKAHEKCPLCDNHTISPHLPQTYYICLFNKVVNVDYSDNVKNFFFLTLSISSIRGPPSVSSFSV